MVGRSGSCSEGVVRKLKPFDSDAHSLKDDGGESFRPNHSKRGVYAELVGCYTSPSDWVLNLSIQSGKYKYMYMFLTACCEILNSFRALKFQISFRALKFQTSFSF